LGRPAYSIASKYERSSLYLSPFLPCAVFFNETATLSIGVGNESTTAVVTVKKPIDDHQNLFELGENSLADWTFHPFPPFSLEKSKKLFEKLKPPICFLPVCCFKFIHRTCTIG